MSAIEASARSKREAKKIVRALRASGYICSRKGRKVLVTLEGVNAADITSAMCLAQRSWSTVGAPTEK